MNFIVLYMQLFHLLSRAAITSHVISKRMKLPFTDLEGLLASDYDVITTANSSKEALFRLAPPESTIGKIWSQKMSKVNFHGLLF